LIQFDKPGERIWGDYSSKQDLGHYAVNYRTEDINVLWPRLLKAGATPKSAPEFWQVNEELAAWDSMCFDPDGVILDIFKVEGKATEKMGTVPNDVSEVQTMAIHVADARRSQAFYQGIGYEVLYDKVVENMEEFFGVPKGTNLHNVNLFKPALSPNGRIEIAQYVGFLGKELRDKAAPPNVGILSISFETDDIDDTVKLVQSLGGQSIGGPIQLELAPFGEIQLATFFGPDGEVVEFFQRL
jgi:predicted lactoylglutathione lyase